jgi:hypothetical protein
MEDAAMGGILTLLIVILVLFLLFGGSFHGPMSH